MFLFSGLGEVCWRERLIWFLGKVGKGSSSNRLGGGNKNGKFGNEE